MLKKLVQKLENVTHNAQGVVYSGVPPRSKSKEKPWPDQVRNSGHKTRPDQVAFGIFRSDRQRHGASLNSPLNIKSKPLAEQLAGDTSRRVSSASFGGKQC